MLGELYERVGARRAKAAADEIYLHLLRGTAGTLVLPLLLDLLIVGAFVYLSYAVLRYFDAGLKSCISSCYNEDQRCCLISMRGLVLLGVGIVSLYLSQLLALYLTRSKRFLRSALLTVAIEVVYLVLVYPLKISFLAKVLCAVAIFLLSFLAYRSAVRLSRGFTQRSKVTN